MATFPTTNKAPGVYIQEITIPGPLPAVSTSNAAFVGPAAMGPLLTPTQITSFDQFKAIFGSYLEDPYRVYAAHAVNGFFAEGGALCYFVRVGTGKRATLNLLDRSGNNRTALVVTALKEGVAGNSITVQVADDKIATTTAVVVSVAIAAGQAPPNQRKVGTASDLDAAKFNPGDTVLVSKGALKERATISSISKDAVAHTTTFTLVSNLTNDYGGGAIALADLIPGQTKFRVTAATGLEPGSYISITRAAVTENAVVRVVDQTNNFITLEKPLANTYLLDVTAVDIVSQEFALTIKLAGNPDEIFTQLSVDPRHSHYFKNGVASASVSIDFSDPPTVTPPTKNLPVAVGATNLGAAGQGIAGVDENLNALQPSHYHDGIDALKKKDDVNLLCVPDAASGQHFQVADTQDIQAYMVQHCEKMQDRFAILDSRKLKADDIVFQAVQDQRANLNSDNGYGALYFPWIGISNPFGSGTILIPPSGHTAGVFANNDNNFGVFKAPANEQIRSALSAEATVTDAEQGPLNEKGINVVRKFPSQGIKIWGARTISPVTPWRYVNVRRLVTFIEKTIQEGTRFAVFEPNNLTLWKQIKRLVTDFLTGLWTEGALFGDTPDLAFRVRVDETLNPPDTRALGLLVVEVTVVPTTPAEFIVFRVIQDITGATLRESTT
jgi:phage tail sheath protein FI